MPTKPLIDYLKCNHCGVCISICPMKVYDKEEGKVIVKKPSECIACRACEVQCPEKAIGIIDLKEEKRVDEEIKEVIKKEEELVKELENDIKEEKDEEEKKELKEELKREKEVIKELEKEIKEDRKKEKKQKEEKEE